MQKLTLPLGTMMLQAGYKNATYKQKWGWQHYGVDATNPNSRDVLALGEGEVVAAGQDGTTLTGPNSRLGNVLVIIYRDVELVTGEIAGVVCRMYHLDEICVEVGDTVHRGEVVAKYGNTGANTTGAHLHIEFDADTNWPTLAPGVTIGAGKVINAAATVKKAGGIADSTLAPQNVWHIGEGQQLDTKWLGSWVGEDDLNVQKMPAEGFLPSESGESAAELVAELERLVQRLKEKV